MEFQPCPVAVARMVMNGPTPKIVEVPVDTVTGLIARADAQQFESEDYQTTKIVCLSLLHLTELIRAKDASIRRLRKLLFGASTEKTNDLLGGGVSDGNGESLGDPSNEEPPANHDGSATPAENNSQDDPPKPKPGHGRNAAKDYEGAEKISVPHDALKSGDPCPQCKDGTLYEVSQPGVLIRIVGQAPLHATVYQLQKLRCNLCGKVFTAQPPPEAGDQKYDAAAGTIIALLKYGSGLPFNRLRRLQDSLGIPLAASTQWDIVKAKAGIVAPAYEELIRQAAQGDVLHNDDTAIKILQFMGKRAKEVALAQDTADDDVAKKKERTGLFTSGIVSTREGRRIALFFSGRRHAGENLRDVLVQRAQDLQRPIQMCDALSRNAPGELQTILANCLVHGRRQFVEILDHFPDECGHVITALEAIYTNDAEARKQKLSPGERLLFHQAHSAAIMSDLHDWLTRQLDDHLVEPNSELGKAISYMLKHWHKLTLFLHQAGAPLDNNICERALKKAILHRKNSLFFKTTNGAHVADIFMSLIYTCELCRVNPFDYLTQLELHASELAANPERWMPWNYRATLSETPADS
jgi:transposase